MLQNKTKSYSTSNQNKKAGIKSGRALLMDFLGRQRFAALRVLVAINSSKFQPQPHDGRLCLGCLRVHRNIVFTLHWPALWPSYWPRPGVRFKRLTFAPLPRLHGAASKFAKKKSATIHRRANFECCLWPGNVPKS